MNPAIGPHPIIGYQLNQDHMADLRHQAQRHALARAARRAAGHGHTNPATTGQRCPRSPATPWPC
jgi:hypothetical protein